MFKISKVLSVGFFLVSVIGIFGCSSSKNTGTDPKRQLSDYISQSFALKSPEDRKLLLPYLTGDVKARLSSWSDDQFQEAFIDSKRQFVKLYYREVKPVSPSEVQITYELTYSENNKNKQGQLSEVKVTTKKLCQMVLKEGKWLISDVRNIKELLEFKNELTLP